MSWSHRLEIALLSATITGCSTLGAGNPASDTGSPPAASERPLEAAAGGEIVKYGRSMAKPMTLEVKGSNGTVRASTASGAAAEIRASKRVVRGDPNSQRVVVNENPEGTVVCVLYADEGDDACKAGREDHRHHHGDDAEIRIDFELRVPEGVALRAATLNGDVDVRGLRSDVEAHTLNGALRLATTGRITASGSNGEIVATALGPGEPDPIDLSTMNGRIELRLADRSGFELDASTMRGHVESDFPLPAATPGFGPSVIRGAVAGGGQPLKVKTMNGDIELRRVR